MPTDLIASLRFGLEIARRLKWFFIALFYLAGFGALEFRFTLILAPFFLLSVWAYVADKQRELEGKDDFRGGLLFYRYGQEITRFPLSIPVKAEWDAEETSRFTRSLQADLASRITSRLSTESVQVIEDLAITDKASGEQKRFLRVLVRSRFGSMLTHCIHYASFGRTITAHYFTFIRGTYGDWSVVEFVLESPFTIWFWGIPWLLNRHSIIADISKWRESSFDAIDIQTMYSLTHRVVLEETREILRENDLLDESSMQIIQYHIQNGNSVQNLNLSGPGAFIGSISQSVDPPVRSASRH